MATLHVNVGLQLALVHDIDDDWLVVQLAVNVTLPVMLVRVLPGCFVPL